LPLSGPKAKQQRQAQMSGRLREELCFIIG
jgi:hypothetical protein